MKLALAETESSLRHGVRDKNEKCKTRKQSFTSGQEKEYLF